MTEIINHKVVGKSQGGRPIDEIQAEEPRPGVVHRAVKWRVQPEKVGTLNYSPLQRHPGKHRLYVEE